MNQKPPRFLQYALAPVLAFLCVSCLVLSITGSAPYAVGAILGPFAGAVARDWQSCCAENSWAIAPYAFASLGIGLTVQLLWHPEGRALRFLRALVWWLASASWFVAAILSYAHALE
jgi:hypothetical protein